MVLQTQSSLSRDLMFNTTEKVPVMSVVNNNTKNMTTDKINFAQVSISKKIVVQLEDGIHIVPLDQVIRIESNHNYVFIHLQDGKSIFLLISLKEIEEALINHHFVRTHNSHIINLNYLFKIKKESSHYALLSNKTRVPISRRRMSFLIEQIRKWAIWF